jgi:hypothetical protein
MKLYMFRTVPLSIISSYSLYIQQWYVIQVCRQLSSRIRMICSKAVYKPRKLSTNLYDIYHC